MRKLIPVIVAVVIGTSIGLGSSEVWLRARTLPYCKVANNAESYHMRFVRVKAKIHFDAGGMYIYEDCDPVEALAAAVVFGGNQPAVGIAYVNELLLSGGGSRGCRRDRRRRIQCSCVAGLLGAEVSHRRAQDSVDFECE